MFQPLKNLILARPASPQMMQGAIHIPQTRSSKNQTFHWSEVISVGGKVEHCKPGDKIYVSEYWGDQIEVDGEKLTLGSERDVTAIVDK
jgi:co-chaperonin GroES (HSP10)